jgi:hypothetical protein
MPTFAEPLGWFCPSANENLSVLQQAGDSLPLYVTSAGKQILSIQAILDKVHPSSGPESSSCNALREACLAFAQSQFCPDASSKPRALTTASFASLGKMIDLLISHPFWRQLDVLAAPLHMRHRRWELATSADLLVRFRNGSDIGLGHITYDQRSAKRVAAEVGASIAFLNDTYAWWPRRAFVVFCAQDRIAVEVIDADTAVIQWIESLDFYRALAPALGWQVIKEACSG